METQRQVTHDITGTDLESVTHLNSNRRIFWRVSRSYTGSAVLFRSRYLLTAGHNVYQDRTRINHVDVRCGVLDASEAPRQERVWGSQVIDASGYSGSPFTRDFGVIRLAEPVAVARPFRLAERLPEVGEPIRFAGFPGENFGGWDMYEADGKITRLEDGLVHYDIDTARSNSGGPMWRATPDGPELLGIHVKEGCARMVDQDFRDEIDRLIAELDSRA